MPTNIEIVDSPRPEVEPPLPTYHALLDALCEEFNVPGSPTFWQAMTFIKEHHMGITQKFTNWYKSIFKSERLSDRLAGLFQEQAVTPEGRLRIVASYVHPARIKLETLQQEQEPIRKSGARREALVIENLIAILPERERFSEPVMALRRTFFELITLVQRGAEPPTDENPPYTGPRPTRFERLLFNNDSEEDPD